jgi:hypothetical protein
LSPLSNGNETTALSTFTPRGQIDARGRDGVVVPPPHAATNTIMLSDFTTGS